jgi:hypothetical protein
LHSFTLLIALAACYQVTAIEGETTVPRDHLVRLQAVGAADSILWDVEPAESADLGPDGSSALFFAAKPGKYIVRATGATTIEGRVSLSRARVTITVGDGPAPDPNPGPNPPNPDPPPGPVTDAARAARQWGPLILQAHAIGMEAAATRLAAGDTMAQAMTAASEAQAAARTQAMRSTITPILNAILPEGSTAMTDDQRKRLTAAYREAAAALRSALPAGGRR